MLPFAGEPAVQVCLGHASGELQTLIDAHAGEIAQELGAPLVYTPEQARWLLGPASTNPQFAKLRIAASNGPRIRIDRARRLLVCDAPTLDGVRSTLWRLFDLCRLPDGTHEAGPCLTLATAVDRLSDQVAATHPAVARDARPWSDAVERFATAARTAHEPLHVLQEWVATLGDGHSWVRAGAPCTAPYGVQVRDGIAVFVHVEPDTAGARAGLVAGSRWVVDGADAALRRACAAPHARSWAAGRLLLSGPSGPREFEVVTPDGARVRWAEDVVPFTVERSVRWRWLEADTLLLRIAAFLPSAEGLLAEALAVCRQASRVVLDLRGNPGGASAAAERFRSAFQPRTRVVGHRVSRLPSGGLSEPHEIEVSPHGPRIRARTWVLVDGRTGSAAEDVVLGLRGLPNVTVVGEPTAGAMGWIRVLPLLEEIRLAVRFCTVGLPSGEPVDGFGMPVDAALEPGVPAEQAAMASIDLQG